MVNLEEPPLHLLSETKERLGEEEIKLLLASDLGEEDGTTDYLAITKSRLAVISASPDGSRTKYIFDLKDIEDVRSTPLVGCGALEARINGEWVRLLRYSNVLAPQFALASKNIMNLKEGREELEEDKEIRRCPKCNMPLPSGSQVCPRCLPKGKVLRRLLSYAKPYKWVLALAGALVLIDTALNLVPLYINRYLVDNILIPRKEGWVLGIMILAWLLIRVVSTGIVISRGRLTAKTGQRMMYDLRTALYRTLQRLSVTFYDKYPTGSLISRITQDISSLQGFLAHDIHFFAANILLLIGISAVLIQMNWELALLTLLPAPLIIFFVSSVWRYIYLNYRRLWHRWSRFVAILSDSLSGVRVIKAFAQEDKEAQRFDKRATALWEAGVRAELLNATFAPVLSLLIGSTSFIIWYFGGKEVVGGAMTTGTLFAFLSALGMLFGPIQVVLQMSTSIANALAASERVFEIMDAETEEVEEGGPKISMPYVYGNVEFRNVTFGYDKYQPILHNINLKVRAGEMVGIVGPSGAGKTTIINLICRFYLPTEGEILIDGVNIKDINIEDLRKQIGLVPQEPFLFHSTIADNIAYAKEGANKKEIIRCAKAANAHDFILFYPDGYDTMVGERGTRLSGGQRQRVAIARALLHNPRILILDEATSSVDTEAEKQIQEALTRLVRGRTTFAIAHRLSTLRIADRIVVLKNGRIVEEGRSEELLSYDSEYKRLVELQAGPITSPDQWTIKREEVEEMDIGPLFLPPSSVRFERTEGNVLKLWVEGVGEFRKVSLRRLFPLTDPDHYISVLNTDYREVDTHQEIGVIVDLSLLPEDSRRLVEQELQRTYFIAQVKRIISLKELYGFTEWVVETDKGQRKFLTWGLHHSVIDMGGRRLIIVDVDDIYYEIKDWALLDPKSIAFLRRIL